MIDINIEGLITIFNSFGYAGIFLVSFIGSIIPFVPIPYFPILILGAVDDQLNPNFISISSAAGAVIAKLIIFYASFYGRKALNKKTKTRMKPLQLLLAKYGWIGAFVAALTLIPDDIVFIPLGLARYSPWKFAIATFSGKFILNEIIVWSSVILGRPFFESFISTNIDPLFLTLGIIASIAILVIIVYLAVRIDWARVIESGFLGQKMVQTMRISLIDRSQSEIAAADDGETAIITTKIKRIIPLISLYEQTIRNRPKL